MHAQISSAANPTMKRLARLAKRRDRDEEGVFVVEGERLITRAIAAGLAPVEVYGDGSVDLPGVGMTLVRPEVLDRVSYRSRSEGVVAVFRQEASTLDEVLTGHPALVLVAENLEKPGNLGAILRTADAVGADAVATVPPGIDRFNPNAIRASTGACFTVPTVGVDIVELRAWLDRRGIVLVAADPSAGEAMWEVDLTVPVALMVGAEDEGLSDAAHASADMLVTIPMAGSVDSLNTSVAMALLAYETHRQRSVSGLVPPKQ